MSISGIRRRIGVQQLEQASAVFVFADVLVLSKLAALSENDPQSALETYEDISHSSSGNDRGTLTDICCSPHQLLGEVDLVSLIEEQLPRYILRADALTNFTGYDNFDWIVRTPCLPLDVDFDFSSEFISETLKYFVACGDRLSQMTKTYNDIGAVTQLLEESKRKTCSNILVVDNCLMVTKRGFLEIEAKTKREIPSVAKERDLELAARIGQKLLANNNDLQERVDVLEDQLREANDKVSQLKHVICIKDALLQAYVKDLDDCEPPDSPSGRDGIPLPPPSPRLFTHMDVLQKKVKALENENLQLRIETVQLTNEATDYEEKEAGLVSDCVRQLTETSACLQATRDELDNKIEVNAQLQNKVTGMLTEILSLNKQIKKLTDENIELKRQLEIHTNTQKELCNEIIDWESKYEECHTLLRETQLALRETEKKQKPGVIRYHYSHLSPYLSGDSLAFELEDSIRKDFDYPIGLSPAERKRHSLRVMQTARAVKSASSAVRHALTFEPRAATEPRDVDASKNFNSSSSELGEDDLLNSTVTENHNLSTIPVYDVNECSLRSISPDSFMSTGSGSNLSDLAVLRIPEKLQIVKPLEGSHTLYQWKSLATPNLCGVLEDRPGIQIKGERNMGHFEEDPYSISDYEEDEDLSPLFMKCSDRTSSTYTFTNSTVTHPSDIYVGSPVSSSLCSAFGSCVSNGHVSPPSSSLAFSSSCSISTPNLSSSYCTLNDRCASTYSISASLAHLLNERTSSVDDETVKSKLSLSWWSSLKLPHRFRSIMSDTITVHDNASLESTSGSKSLTTSITSTNDMTLSEKVKNLGLDRLLDWERKSSRNPVNVGLNTIRSMKRLPVSKKTAAIVCSQGVNSSVLNNKEVDYKTAVGLEFLSSLDAALSLPSSTGSSVLGNDSRSTVDIGSYEISKAVVFSSNGFVSVPEILLNSAPILCYVSSVENLTISTDSRLSDASFKPASLDLSSICSNGVNNCALVLSTVTSLSTGPIVHARIISGLSNVA